MIQLHPKFLYSGGNNSNRSRFEKNNEKQRKVEGEDGRNVHVSGREIQKARQNLK
jgi:hypothetical protein